MIPSPCMTQKEAAKYLRISPRTLERHRVAGTLCRFTRCGGRVLYRVEVLNAYLAEQTFRSTAEAAAAQRAESVHAQAGISIPSEGSDGNRLPQDRMEMDHDRS